MNRFVLNSAYEACKANHDFVVIEGTSLKGAGDDTITLNAKLAQTLGSSALLVTDAGIYDQVTLTTFL